MTTHKSHDFPELTGDAPAELLITLRFQWYFRHATRARIMYRSLGSVQVLAAVMIATSVAVDAPRWLAPVLGGVIALSEGLRTLFGFKDTYPTWTRTAQQLRNEAWLYAAKAGRYTEASDPVQLLAERVVTICEEETSDWEAALRARTV
jgi:hypothetical protein